MSASPLALSPRNPEPAAMHRSLAAPTRLQQEAVQARLLLAATYPFFLAAVAVQRALPSRDTRPGVAAARRSMFGEAKAMAVAAIPFVFMG